MKIFIPSSFVSLLLVSLFLASCKNEAKKDETETVKEKPSIEKLVRPAGSAIARDSISFSGGFIEPGSVTIFLSSGNVLMKDSSLVQPSGELIAFGDTVFIEKICENHYSPGDWEQPVYEVSYSNNGRLIKGFVNQERLAIDYLLMEDGNKIAVALIKEDQLKMNLHLLNPNNKAISVTKVSATGGEQYEDGGFYYNYSVDLFKVPAKGLQNVKNVLFLGMYYEACGYANNVVTFFYDGKNVFEGLAHITASDAGLFHAHSFSIFPWNEKGKSNEIIYVTTNEEMEEVNEEEGSKRISYDSLALRYVWNANKGLVLRDTLTHVIQGGQGNEERVN